MKKSFPILINTILACLFIVGIDTAVFACSMALLPEPPRSMVKPGQYILVGEVVGYTEPIVDPKKFKGEVVGLKLKVVESIHIPQDIRDGLELFRFSHDADCVAMGISAKPPIGTRFRMALFPTTLVTSKSGSGVVRLQSEIFSILDNDQELFGFSTTADNEFDYKNDLPRLNEKIKQSQNWEYRRWHGNFLFIETSKDLIRLANAKTEAERMKILERLLYCPGINYRRLLYSVVGKPFKSEENQLILKLLPPGQSMPPPNTKKLTKREKELMQERSLLENSGALMF